MNILKVRITIQSKKDWGTRKAGEIETFYNDVFNDMNGIAFFAIDIKQWKVLSYAKFSGMFDKNKKEIYETDYVSAKCTIADTKKTASVFGQVVFHKGCFGIKIIRIEPLSGYDVGQIIPLFDFKSLELSELNEFSKK